MKKERFLVHAVILAVAGFVSRALGLLYAVPLYHIIGEEGNGYYGTAYEIYNMLLLITAYSMPMAISKIMSVYVAEKDYVNCKRLFRTCLFYVIVVGGIGAVVTYIFADSFVIAPAALSLRVMAPTIFFSGILSVLRGYTQAHNTMIPTAVSQMVEQLFNAVCSIVFAVVLVRFASAGGGQGILDFLGIDGNYVYAQAGKNSIMSKNDMTIPPTAFGAMGSALGTLVGVLVALIYMVICIMLTKNRRKQQYVTDNSIFDENRYDIEYKGNTDYSDKSLAPESYFTLFRVIFMYASPIILTSFIYNLATTIDMKIFWNWALGNGYSQETAASIFGIYSRQYLVLINVPIAIASAISSSMLPSLSVEFSSNELESVKARISKSVRSVVVCAVPSVVGLMVLSKPIMQLLFKGTSEAASDALVLGSISVLFFSVATVLNTALQAMGKSLIAIKNVTRALIIHILYVVGMLKVSGAVMGILVTGSVLYSMAMCFGNIKSLEKYFHSRLNVIDVVGKPVIASLIMGVISILAYTLLNSVGLGIFLSLLITVGISVIVYFVMFYFKDDYMVKTIFRKSIRVKIRAKNL